MTATADRALGGERKPPQIVDSGFDPCPYRGADRYQGKGRALTKTHSPIYGADHG